MDFAAVGALADYLHELGISHVYLAPIFKARSGSTHGYDIVEPGEFDPALGDHAGFDRMAAALREHGLSLILDLVPNHLCVLGTDNPWWSDVLENGPSSLYAGYFDVDWQPPKADLADKVLLPVLGEPFGRALAFGRLRVARAGASLCLDCNGLRLPLAPKSWPTILQPACVRLRTASPGGDPVVEELESVLTAIAHLPSRQETAEERVRERRREKGVIARRLEELVARSPAFTAALDAAIADMAPRDASDSPRLERLQALLDEQGYRLSHWRVAADEINYRRFFDVNELAAIRVEQPEVFEAVHHLPLELVASGAVQGLRIDHVDGLYAPAEYLRRLRHVPWVVVEKILAEDEELPAGWEVAGTTGYEFLNRLGGLFVVPESQRAFEDLFERFVHERHDPHDVAYECRKLVLRVALCSELTALARRLDRISEQHRDSRDFTLRGIEHALSEVLACFPVYRTYVEPGEEHPSAADAARVETAVAEARRRNPAQSGALFDFVASVLLFRDPEGLAEAQRAERRHFVLRFQQLTGPVMAKGVEDTAAYRHFPLASVVEVGAECGGWATSVEAFHAFAALRQERWPRGFSATSTHDTKRDEDVRARLDVLSEIPEEWERAIAGFRLLLRGWAPAHVFPDATDEYLLYQTLVGSWPLAAPAGAPPPGYGERIRDYMRKAIREAKRHTSWIAPNEAYEGAMDALVHDALDPERGRAFLQALAALVARINPPGLRNTISQVLIKGTAPGVPDFYQGTELPEFRLVDPDNRGAVDFARRREVLAALGDPLPGELGALLADGRLKFLVTRQVLAARRRQPALFDRGAYRPLAATGARARHVVAFAREHDGAAVLVVAARFFASLPASAVGTAAWGATALPLAAPPGAVYRDALSGQTLRVHTSGTGPELRLAEVFAQLPQALLERVE